MRSRNGFGKWTENFVWWCLLVSRTKFFNASLTAGVWEYDKRHHTPSVFVAD